LSQGHFPGVFWFTYFLYFYRCRIDLLAQGELSYIADWSKPASLWERAWETGFS
jgi:hypothetical protein